MSAPISESSEWEFDDDWECDRCGGDGYIAEEDGDPSDWGEDTYCGPANSVIRCRKCNGTGSLAPPTPEREKERRG